MILHKSDLLAFLIGITGAALVTAVPVQAETITDNTRIEEGIYILDMDVSNKTVAEARTMVNDYCSKITNSSLTVTFSDKQESILMSGLGLQWESDTAVEQAANYAKSGPLISRYKERKDLRYDNAHVDIPYSYNKEAINQFVTEQIASYDTEPVDAILYREDGEFYVEDDVTGLCCDVNATVNTICQTLDTSLSASTTCEATVEVTAPEVTAELLSNVQDRLGTYSTDYSSSSYNRKTNIKVAAGRLNGSLLMPGDSLSVSDTILSRNEENGYLLAPQYANGQTEDSYGGGVCQVSTTLYNAVLRAELQVDERSPHSMVVHYVPYASDAAISEGNKDFIFTNNTDYPIYLAASADGEDLIFSLYGKETRPESRTIEFVSKTISEDYPEPTIEYDDDEYEGYEETSGSSSPSVTATLTKVVYENGVEVERTLLHTDHYAGKSKTIVKGTKKYEEEKPTTPETTPPGEEETETAPPEDEEEEEEDYDDEDDDEEDDDDDDDDGDDDGGGDDGGDGGDDSGGDDEMIDPPEDDEYDDD